MSNVISFRSHFYCGKLCLSFFLHRSAPCICSLQWYPDVLQKDLLMQKDNIDCIALCHNNNNVIITLILSLLYVNVAQSSVLRKVQTFKQQFSIKRKEVVIIKFKELSTQFKLSLYSASCWWNAGRRFIIRWIFLELHSQRILLHNWSKKNEWKKCLHTESLA